MTRTIIITGASDGIGAASARQLHEAGEQVIVVGRVAPTSGPAEEILTGPNAPAKLWLKGLPGSGDRAKIPGTARQETWVRMYLPVRQ